MDEARPAEAEHSPVLWKAIYEIAQLESRLHRSEEQWVASMLAAANFKDDETCEHIERMSRFAETIMRTVSNDSEQARMMRLASQLHDVGKLGVPDTILLKVGPLSSDETEMMQRHTIIGRGILAKVDSEIARLAATIAFSHHEHWDGGGYPQRLRGSDIPEVARMAAIADTFDALTTNRIYRKAYSIPQALRMMGAEKGRQFDPDLLDAFFTSIDRIMDIAHEYPDETLVDDATG